ncbi:hypothetical protein ABZ532_24375 [Streptomyces sp. NPDC019396]|uniref:SCO2400 family protein n=1 Tax=Streptomyces sp. NPDC019396 TaxID=3154687 RepID=UPI0033E1E806
MDYCYQCRRHLNGALACAGCGTPAEGLRYHNPAVVPAAMPAARVPVAEAGPAPVNRPSAAPSDEVVVELGGAYDEPRTPSGHRRAPTESRKTRRSAGVRRRRKRGRKVVVGAVGLALAAGVLSLTELAKETVWGGDGASVEVREEEAPPQVEEIPDPAVSDLPAESPSGVSEAPETESAAPRPSATGGGGPTGRPVAVGSSSKAVRSGSSLPAPDHSSDDSASESPESGGKPSDPGGAGSAKPTKRVGPPPAPTPTPTPSPSETCTWFLFWCT